MFSRSKVHRMNVCDTSWFDKFSKKAVKPGGRYCVAATANKESWKNTSYTPGISMPTFPAEPKVRAKRVKFVQKHCIHFGELVIRYTALCSTQFRQGRYKSRTGSTRTASPSQIDPDQLRSTRIVSEH